MGTASSLLLGAHHLHHRLLRVLLLLLHHLELKVESGDPDTGDAEGVIHSEEEKELSMSSSIEGSGGFTMTSMAQIL